MSNRTSLNIPTPDLSDEPAAYLNPGGGNGPFAVVTLGPQIWLYIHDAAHARAIAAAFTEAADLLDAGHGENHTDNAGHVLGACVPGECITCGATVSSTGKITPAEVAL